MGELWNEYVVVGVCCLFLSGVILIFCECFYVSVIFGM